MRPSIAIFDDFLECPLVAREEILAGKFEDYQSPWDSVVYPDINKNLPDWVKEYVGRRLAQITGGTVEVHAMFARATTSKTPAAPHKIHSDKIMGQYSAHIYLSRDWPEGAGTSFWDHVTEGPKHTDETNVDVVVADANNASLWVPVFTAQGKFNRVILHDACYWHCAEPVGGWGDGLEDGRLVLTCFFSVAEVDR